MRSLEAVVRRVLDQRLLRDVDQPIAVGLSGGGDSVALTLLAHDWARSANRSLIILCVDHGLQVQGAEWVQFCRRLAERLGHAFRPLAWAGEKPGTGLPAAAREARHRLLADAARAAGARVILLGHTADDRLESQAMRSTGANTPDPYEWAPSPVWPDGRGLFLLRPMLAVRRAHLRDWLRNRGETWIEDPANSDLRSGRARARLVAVSAADPLSDPRPRVDVAKLATHHLSTITLGRQDLRHAPVDEARRFVALASVCAGGGSRTPSGPRIARLTGALRCEGPMIATLAGARLEADAHQVRFVRDAGDIRRRGPDTVNMRSGEPVIWDGRFRIAAQADGGQIRSLSGLAQRLSPDERHRLRDLPASVRGGLPAHVRDDGQVTCPALSGAAVSLIPDRLAAASGLIEGEPRQPPFSTT